VIQNGNFTRVVEDNGVTHFFATTDLAGGPWTSWAARLVQSSAVATTVNYAKFILRGKMMFVQFDLSATAAGTANNAVQVELPKVQDSPNGYVPAQFVSGTSVWGSGQIALSGTVYQGTIISSLGTSPYYASMVRSDVTGNSFVGVSPNVALANGDRFIGSLHYEVV